MHWPIISKKLWLAPSLVVIMLLSGCQSTPLVEPEPHKPVSIQPRIDEGTTTPSAPAPPGIPVATPPPPVSTPITTPPNPDTPSLEPASAEEGIHIVQPGGETLYSIAIRYGQKLEDVAAWNNLAPPYYLGEGQRLVVFPPASQYPSIPEPAPLIPLPADGDRDYHVMLPGDDLEDIAKHYNVSVDELAAWNGLQPPYDLEPAQELRVRPPDDVDSVFPMPPSPAPFWPSETVDDNDTVDDNGENYDDHIVEPEPVDNGSDSIDYRPSYHVVQLGETLNSIAEKYGVSRSDLAKWNKIGSPYTVFPGLKLTLVPSP